MEQTYNTKHVIISLFIVVAVIVIFYGITVLLTKNKKESITDNNIPEATIQYEEILVGEIFNQKETEYYVLAYASDNGQTYISSLNTYSKLENATKSYQIDLTSGFNKKYVSSENNFEGQYPTFGETTLLKIVDKQIVEKYTGSDITTQIEKMTNMGKE